MNRKSHLQNCCEMPCCLNCFRSTVMLSFSKIRLKTAHDAAAPAATTCCMLPSTTVYLPACVTRTINHGEESQHEAHVAALPRTPLSQKTRSQLCFSRTIILVRHPYHAVLFPGCLSPSVGISRSPCVRRRSGSPRDHSRCTSVGCLAACSMWWRRVRRHHEQFSGGFC